MVILVFLIGIFGVTDEHFNWEIGKTSFVDGSGYISINVSTTSNTFELKEVTSDFL